MSTAKMKQLIAVVLARDADKVTKELLRQGVLHFIKVRELGGVWESGLEAAKPPFSEDTVGALRKRIESFLSLAGRTPREEGKNLDIGRLVPVNPDEADKMLDKLGAELQEIREKQRYLQQEILRLEDMKRQLNMFGEVDSNLITRSKYSFLNIQTGRVPQSRVETLTMGLKEIPSVLLPFNRVDGQINMLLITMKRDNSRVNSVLEKVEWEDVELSSEMKGSKPEIIKNIDKKLGSMQEEQKKLETRSKDVVANNLEMLEVMWANLRMNELYCRIQSYFSQTAKTKVFSGWLPESHRRDLEKSLREATGGKCHIEWHDAESLDREKGIKPPVQFKNPRFLEPFQMLVQNYSVPEYGTVDPTPFVAFAFLIMFGLMFGDVGQGAVLFLGGLLGSHLLKGKKEGLAKLLKLITWCGASSMIMGVLFGSYFGMGLFKALWFDYHGIITGHSSGSGYVRSVYDILMITIYFGIAVIAVGLLLNWINLIRKGEWIKLFLDKGGVAGGWMYGAGVYTAFYFVQHDYRALPSSVILALFFGPPALAFLAKAPLEAFSSRERREGKGFTIYMFMDFIMEWMVELLEVSSGYLANTLSFMRVAGLGIAHVSLMSAFFTIADMVSRDGLNFWSMLVLVSGNLLVIALEGLSAGIQSLRLNYYEFFSKYFTGGGEVYSPVSLRSAK